MSTTRAARVAITLALVSFACGKDVPPPEPVIRPVRTTQVFSTGAGRTRTFSGTSQAALESRLSFKVAGTIARLAVSVGSRVSAGDPIATLDDKDYRLQVQEAEAALNSARAQSRNTEANYSRVRALYENRNASANDLDAARAASESANAQMRQAGKGLELAQSKLSYTDLRSPVTGSIASVSVEQNENVSPGQQIALLTSGSQLEVLIAIPEKLIAQIREGDDAIATFDAIADRRFPATVIEVGGSSTGAATTFPVSVRIDHTDPACRPGMAAEVQLTFGEGQGKTRLIIPPVAVGEDRAGRFVFVVEPGETGMGTTRRTSVTVGELTQEGLEIHDGLNDGAIVVTAGVTRIHDGQTVRLLQ